MTRVRAGSIFLLIVAFLATQAQGALAVLAPADQSAATGATGVQGGDNTAATDQQAAQATRSCPEPRLTGLPNRPKFTNATIHLKLLNMTDGALYIVRAGTIEVLGDHASSSTVKGSFQLPDQGPKSHKIPITAIVSIDSCENSPWKLQKNIEFKAVKAPSTQAPAATAPAPTPTSKSGTSVKPVTPTPAKPVKPVKLPKPLIDRVPRTGPPLSQRIWLTPFDGGARLNKPPPEPRLSRLERRADKAHSSNALVGLGIVFGLLVVSTVGGLMVFSRRDDTAFDAAMAQQRDASSLQHLEEGDPGLAFETEEEPSTDPISVQMADEAIAPPGADDAEVTPVAAAPAAEPPSPEHRAQVEAELQHILNEAGLEAHLEGILMDARTEAERQGITIDPDLMLQALCDEINGSAQLSDAARAEIRSKFQEIIAEEAQRVPEQAPS